MIILCASHINSAQRLIYLNSMIISWYNQTIQKPLYISISYDIHIKREIIKLMEHWKNKTTFFNFTIRHGKCSQFEHYNYLLNENKSFSDKWILFTDDDDLWNTNRIEKYLEYIHHVKLDYFSIPNTITNDYLYISFINEIDLDKCNKYPVNEYFNYCIKYTKLIETINNVKEKFDLSNPTFDLYFTTYLTFNDTNSLNKNFSKNEWLYFYRMYFVCDNYKWSNQPN
jgi:hypothetical protein